METKKKIVKIIVLSLALIVLVVGGFYFYSGIKAIKNTDDKFLVDYHSTKRTNSGVAGVETDPSQSILTESIQPAGSTSPKSTTKSSNSQQSSQTTTQPSPALPPPPSCNQAQKAALTARYNADMADAARVRDQSKTDARNRYLAELEAIEQRYKDVWDPFERDRLRTRARELAKSVLDDSLSMADMEYNGRVTVYTLAYTTTLRDINC